MLQMVQTYMDTCAIEGVRVVQLDCGASTIILGTESVVVQVEGSKDRGKAHDWAEGAEVEAGDWAGTPDPAALDAWHREPSPEASRPAPDAAQALGDAPPPGKKPPSHATATDRCAKWRSSDVVLLCNVIEC